MKVPKNAAENFFTPHFLPLTSHLLLLTSYLCTHYENSSDRWRGGWVLPGCQPEGDDAGDGGYHL